jgi:eukaryotic-like serine/threonine-protein kinase
MGLASRGTMGIRGVRAAVVQCLFAMAEESLEMRIAKRRVGTTINDKWHVDAVLGVGGMATVYAATHRNRKRAAIKMLHGVVSADPEVRARFLREGYVANSVGHPGAVAVDDDDATEDGAVFLVMELIEGESLLSRARRSGGRLPLAEVLGYGDQLLDVLVAAHCKGIIHRDIKPENLMISSDGRLKVLDFGIARLRDATAQNVATMTGKMLGTPAFMAPEHALGLAAEVDARSDLWSVGATLFSLITGQYVHVAETTNMLVVAACTKPAPSIATVVEGLPPEVVTLIDKALAFDKNDRWPDARAMLAALRECIGKAVVLSSMPPVPIRRATPPEAVTLAGPSTAMGLSRNTPSSQRKGRRVTILSAGGAACVAAAIALYAVKLRQPPMIAASAEPRAAGLAASAYPSAVPVDAAAIETALAPSSISAQPRASAASTASTASNSATPRSKKVPSVPAKPAVHPTAPAPPPAQTVKDRGF